MRTISSIISKRASSSLSTRVTPLFHLVSVPYNSRFPIQPLISTIASRSSRGYTLHASASPSPSSSDDHDGHAFLHDFCMTIPFSVIALVASATLLAIGGSAVSSKISSSLPLFAASSITIALSSALSLVLWKKGQIGTSLTSLVTMISGAASSFIGYQCWLCLKLKSVTGSTPLAFILWPFLILSSCLSLFAFYNVLAGGNPPTKSKK